MRLGRILGIEIRLDSSWFVIFVLVAWSLSVSYLPQAHPGWSVATYWGLGIATSLLVFVSVLVHELAHSVVSGLQGEPVRDITLFIFGGASHLTREPARPRHELLMAVVGPLTSLGLAGLFGAAWWLTLGTDSPLHAMFEWLARINLLLGLFNLIPGFPLDGGRVLRAIVWVITGDLRQATRVVSTLGELIAYLFMFWGVFQIFAGYWADGLWMAFIGWFLKGAATQGYEQVVLQQILAGHTAREVMMTDCPQVPRRLTLDVVVDQMALPSGRRCFPVVEDGQLIGLLTLHRISNVPPRERATTRVEDVMIHRQALKTVSPDDGLETVMERMTQEDVNQFPVISDGRLEGMVARDSLLSFIQLHSANRSAGERSAT